MNASELQAIKEEFRIIYASWHACALDKQQAKEQKVPVGTLCDSCNEMIIHHTESLLLRLNNDRR